MYTQLIIIFVLLAFFAVLHAVTIFLLIRLLKEKKNNNFADNYQHQKVQNNNAIKYSSSVNFGIVCCENCGFRFDSKHNVCPKCGTPR